MEETAPLIEVSLELVAPDITWSPEVGESGDARNPGTRDHFNGWVGGFTNVGTLMKRLDIGEGDYALELEEDFNILDGVSQIQSVVLANEAECAAFKASFVQVRVPVADDLQQTLQDFIERNGEDGEDPPLELFDAEIAKYKRCRRRSSRCRRRKVIGWIKIDAKPIKQALATWVTKWVFLFTQYLSNKVTNSMDELYAFRALGGEKCWRRTPPRRGRARGGGEDAAAEGREGGRRGRRLPRETGTPPGRPTARDAESKARRRSRAAQEKAGDAVRGDGLHAGRAQTPGEDGCDVRASGRDGGSAQDVRHLGARGDPEAARGGAPGVEQPEEEDAQRPREAVANAAARGEAHPPRLGRVRRKVEKFREIFLHRPDDGRRGSVIVADDVEPAYETLDHFHHGAEGFQVRRTAR